MAHSKQRQSASADSRAMERLILTDGRYPLDAYAFLHEALGEAVRRVHGEEPGKPGSRHVSGQDICIAARDLAVDRWGMLARTVLRRWNVRGTIDLGEMVYLLVTNDFMQKTPEDSIEDFRDVFDLDEALATPVRFELKE